MPKFRGDDQCTSPTATVIDSGNERYKDACKSWKFKCPTDPPGYSLVTVDGMGAVQPTTVPATIYVTCDGSSFFTYDPSDESNTKTEIVSPTKYTCQFSCPATQVCDAATPPTVTVAVCS